MNISSKIPAFIIIIIFNYSMDGEKLNQKIKKKKT